MNSILAGFSEETQVLPNSKLEDDDGGSKQDRYDTTSPSCLAAAPSLSPSLHPAFILPENYNSYGTYVRNTHSVYYASLIKFLPTQYFFAFLSCRPVFGLNAEKKKLLGGQKVDQDAQYAKKQNKVCTRRMGGWVGWLGGWLAVFIYFIWCCSLFLWCTIMGTDEEEITDIDIENPVKFHDEKLKGIYI